jgi:succinate dehydrogenase/fumarate reductase flavoprotein subunit
MGKEKKLVTRRDFLVAGGAVIAAGALSACTPKTTETITSTVATTKTVTNTTTQTAPAQTTTVTGVPVTKTVTTTVLGDPVVTTTTKVTTSTIPGTTTTVKPWIPAKWDKEADIVIVGFGGAGACAALAANERGAKVLLIEKAPEKYAGGNTNVAGGGVRIPDRVDANIAQAYYDLAWGTSPKDMAIDVATALASVPAMFEKWGVPFKKRTSGTDTSPYSMWNATPGPPGYEAWGAGREIWQPLKSLVVKRGIEIMYDTPATALIQSPVSKEIIGVVVKGTQNIKANKGVILACGGYEANYEMQGYFHFPGVKLYPWGSPYNTGDGILMAMAAGADIWHMASTEATAPSIIAPSEQFGVSIGITDANPAGNYIYVNKYGKRFMNEATSLPHNKGTLAFTYFDNSKKEYTNMPFYYIFDETWKKAGPVGWDPIATLTGGAPMLWNGIHRVYQWSKDNEAEITKGWIVKGNTIEELATKIGIDAKGLQDTITRYNGFCTAKVDDDFAKRNTNLLPVVTPPYYGMKMGMSIINTQGGPKHNGKGQTLDRSNNPIPRLYSVGECGSYFGFIYPGGSNLAEAFSFGRIAAEHASSLTAWT